MTRRAQGLAVWAELGCGLALGCPGLDVLTLGSADPGAWSNRKVSWLAPG